MFSAMLISFVLHSLVNLVYSTCLLDSHSFVMSFRTSACRKSKVFAEDGGYWRSNELNTANKVSSPIIGQNSWKDVTADLKLRNIFMNSEIFSWIKKKTDISHNAMLKLLNCREQLYKLQVTWHFSITIFQSYSPLNTCLTSSPYLLPIKSSI